MVTRAVVDLDGAIGYVVAHGDEVDRARLAYLRTAVVPDPAVIEVVESGQLPDAGWPPGEGGQVPSIDATCFRLAELDDLGALGRPAARQAMDWLATVQRDDGTWEEDAALAEVAPPWAEPGSPEARLYLTALAGFWLAAGGLAARPGGPRDQRVGGSYAGMVAAAGDAVAGSLAEDGTWPSYLVTGWLGAALLYALERRAESARMRTVLQRRLDDIAPSGVAWAVAALRRLEVPTDEPFVAAARQRLAETQRSDGSWPSEDGEPFVVHTTLAAIRACR